MFYVDIDNTKKNKYDNLDRFKNANFFIGYLGLYPTLEQSRNTNKYGKLAKCDSKLTKKHFIKQLLLLSDTIQK